MRADFVNEVGKILDNKKKVSPNLNLERKNGFFKVIFFNTKVGEESKEGEAGREVEKEVGTELKEVDREAERLTENQKMILC